MLGDEPRPLHVAHRLCQHLLRYARQSALKHIGARDAAVAGGGRFGAWRSESGEAMMFSDPASIRNTSRRPCSIGNAGADCVRPERRRRST